LQSAQHDDGYLDTLAPHQPTQVTAVHVRESNVQQEKIKSAFEHSLECGPRTMRQFRVEFPDDLELFGQQFCQVAVIVYQEQAPSLHRRSPLAAFPNDDS
jgi:hypothetical protein